jgi:hypothetical protein
MSAGGPDLYRQHTSRIDASLAKLVQVVEDLAQPQPDLMGFVLCPQRFDLCDPEHVVVPPPDVKPGWLRR